VRNAHDHPTHLAHHFESLDQQFASGKLGMWIFLATELLMFSGLFCAYSVYRHNHPEIFEFGHRYLNKPLGALNTIVLITSSFTMAWGVRAAQLGAKRVLIVCLILTLIGGAGFMVIKSKEYHDKWVEHVWFGSGNKYSPLYKGPKDDMEPPGNQAEAIQPVVNREAALAPQTNIPPKDMPTRAQGGDVGQLNERGTPRPLPEAAQAPPAAPVAVVQAGNAYDDPHAGTADAAKLHPNQNVPAGLAPEMHPKAGPQEITYEDLPPQEKERVATFFNIYFLMTGLHGIHVLVGMGLITWILIRATKNEFGPGYFVPVDLVGLYWHLVDLIWIFLFPLLYLIH
jgi:cytochrome c oxidase subunit 3